MAGSPTGEEEARCRRGEGKTTKREVEPGGLRRIKGKEKEARSVWGSFTNLELQVAVGGRQVGVEGGKNV